MCGRTEFRVSALEYREEAREQFGDLLSTFKQRDSTLKTVEYDVFVSKAVHEVQKWEGVVPLPTAGEISVHVLNEAVQVHSRGAPCGFTGRSRGEDGS